MYIRVMEVWKFIPELRGKYMCSSNGRIMRINKDPRCKTQKILKMQVTKDGYISVNCTREYRKRVHRIVAELYIPNPKNYPCINHKDSNRKNNNVGNLEWCTHKQNSRHSNDKGRLGRMSWTVKDIDTGELFRSMKDLAQRKGYDYKSFHGQFMSKKINGVYKNYKLIEKTYKGIF